MDKSRKIDVHWNWVDDEVASINCPSCKEELMIDTGGKDKCKCGKRFILHQSYWVEEIYG